MAVMKKKVRYSAREKTKRRIRKRIIGADDRPRLSVFRSAKHLYAQLISDTTGTTLVSASTLDKDVKSQIEKLASDKSKSSKSLAAAALVGKILAERSKAKNFTKVVFDRSGFLYHGRIKALADGAREGGLQF